MRNKIDEDGILMLVGVNKIPYYYPWNPEDVYATSNKLKSKGLTEKEEKDKMKELLSKDTTRVVRPLNNEEKIIARTKEIEYIKEVLNTIQSTISDIDQQIQILNNKFANNDINSIKDKGKALVREDKSVYDLLISFLGKNYTCEQLATFEVQTLLINSNVQELLKNQDIEDLYKKQLQYLEIEKQKIDADSEIKSLEQQKEDLNYQKELYIKSLDSKELELSELQNPQGVRIQ